MKVSVIIPTFNRPKPLTKTLDALTDQTFPHDQFEVIVVDDGSTKSLVPIKKRTDPFSLHVVHQQNSGATIARNYGASKSSGEFLIFMDDDIRLLPNTLARLIEVLSNSTRSIVMGALVLPVELQTTAFSKLQSGHVVDSAVQLVHWSETMTGLLAIRAADFVTIDQFHDPTGGWPNWDDVDFGYRSDAAGFKLLRCHDAVAEHWDYSIADVDEMGRRYHRAAQSAVRLFQSYPRMVGAIPMFDDKLPITWRQDSWKLIARKLIRPISSTNLVMSLIRLLLHFCETLLPSPRILTPLYRWIIGSYIYTGYRTALREASTSIRTL